MNNAIAGFSKLSKEEKSIGLPKNIFRLNRNNKIAKELLDSDEKYKNYTMNSSKHHNKLLYSMLGVALIS
jgi:hypothetical protein